MISNWRAEPADPATYTIEEYVEEKERADFVVGFMRSRESHSGLARMFELFLEGQSVPHIAETLGLHDQLDKICIYGQLEWACDRCVGELRRHGFVNA